MNCTLLSRGAFSARPTETCLALLSRARLILQEAGCLKDRGWRAEDGRDLDHADGLLPFAIRETVRLARLLKLRLVPRASHVLFEQLLAGELDIAILVEPPFMPPKSLVGHVLRKEPLPYLTQAELAGTDITKHIATAPFIRYDPSSWGGRL